MPGFRTLCFDIGQVLVSFNPQIALDRLAAITGRSANAIWDALAATDLLHRFEKGQLTAESFHRAACGLLRTEVPFSQFCEIWADIFAPEPNIPASLLRSLRQHYHLLTLSNTDAIHFPFLRRRYALFDCFDDFVLSYEVGARKPEPGIFEVAIERGGGNAAEILFIDDIAEYAQAAARRGMNVLEFRSLPQLLDDFRRLGVWPLPQLHVEK